MSIVLLCCIFYGIMRAAMLVSVPTNRFGNAALALLIAVVALYTAPYAIGFAGYYDAYPWLSFAPYNLSLAVGPLIYLYVHAVCAASWKGRRHWPLHLLPALVQLLYYSCVFAQSLAFKTSWDRDVHRLYVEPVETLLLMVSLVVYFLLAWRCFAQPRAMAREWMRNILVALGLTVSLWLIMIVCEFAFSELSYFQRFPFYLWMAMLLCYLGTEGYRHGVAIAEVAPAFPVKPVAAQGSDKISNKVGGSRTVTLAQLADDWRATIIEKLWWRDPELDLATLARLLGTNASTLSRALNDGLGVSFNEMINRMRVDAVLVALTRQPDTPVLDIAIAEGFNSKASFNRAFKLYTGNTPTEYRRLALLSAQVSTSG
ncbi:helix-turn-helix domain-containing protein [Janthinobacterium sp. RB2R34]|uniref:helix-turn-helix domain-containing protein n=1 Tax=Janthinobacterium sp. RB2R34 TaxID=3424193 RepID=UPI003F25EA5D